jgi:hypothetical protein
VQTCLYSSVQPTPTHTGYFAYPRTTAPPLQTTHSSYKVPSHPEPKTSCKDTAECSEHLQRSEQLKYTVLTLSGPFRWHPYTVYVIKNCGRCKICNTAEHINHETGFKWFPIAMTLATSCSLKCCFLEATWGLV